MDRLRSWLGLRQTQRIPESNHLHGAVAAHDRDAAHAIDVFDDLDLTRMADQMIQPVLAPKRDVNEIVFGVVRNAEQREPFRHDLITEVEGCDLYLGPLTDQYIRHGLEVRLPCLLRE